ncbi:MAG: sigma-70 family RNA polymerase sigma factor, partial [bacterium]|nr:sigma-70 family RNA polymerase sigma factor [bacterium]
MKPPSDRKLVEETLQGKGESFSRLIDRYKYAIYGICLSLVGSFHLAEDMAQESFLKAFLNLNRLDDPDRFGNWLRTIAANECRQYLRRNRPRFVPFTQAQEMEGSVARHLLPPDQQR